MQLHHRRLFTWIVAVCVVVCTPQPSHAEAAVWRCLGSKATIVGTNGDDVLTGTAGVDVIVGLGGRDRISGLGGNDRICGDGGDDVLVGGPGKDQLDGGDGSDDLSGGSGADQLRLGPNPTFYDGEGVPYGREHGDGGPGNDIIYGSTGPDRIEGGSGQDRLDGGPDPDRLAGDSGDDVLFGRSGADDLSGGAGDDTGHGGAGNDWWSGARNRPSDLDRFYGDSGSDGSQGGDLGRLRVYGGTGDDRLGGGNGDDVLEGGSGNDSLQGFRGNDALRGGSGRDTISFAERFWDDGASSSGNLSKMRVDLHRGRASGLGNDRLDRVEAVIPGGNSDVLLGSRRAETFYLSAESGGRDIIDGRGGRDTIGPEPDLTYCCPMLRVDLTKRSAWYGYAGEPVEPASTNRVTSIEIVIGTDENDILLGDRRRNTIRGMGGDDVISGRAGRDHLEGGDGDDLLGGGSARDVLRGGRGADRLNGSSGRDRNDGGPGLDSCISPTRGAGARSCEAPFTG